MDDDSKEPPKLSLVSSRSPDEIITKQQASEVDQRTLEIEDHTRELAANMLRIIRGAGRPHLLFDQIVQLYRAMEAWPPGTTVGEITEGMLTALEAGLKEDSSPFGDEIETLESGALRAVAGRLLDQHLQRSAGHKEIWSAVIRLEALREESRRSFAGSRKAAAKGAAVRKKPRSS